MQGATSRRINTNALIIRQARQTYGSQLRKWADHPKESYARSRVRRRLRRREWLPGHRKANPDLALKERRETFVDESGTHTSMDRLRSRAPKGERAHGKVPKNRGKSTALIASMSLSGMGESMCVRGATDAKGFEVYVEHFLAPTLKEG